MYFYYDYSYWIFILPALALTLWAQWRVTSSFNKYSQVRSARGLTGAAAAREVLLAGGVQGVEIERIPGKLTDHYDPRSNVIRLSAAVYDSASIAAVGIAAHEAGHAVQYAQSYTPVRLRQAIIPLSRIGSQLAFVCIIIGILLSSQPLFASGNCVLQLNGCDAAGDPSGGIQRLPACSGDHRVPPSAFGRGSGRSQKSALSRRVYLCCRPADVLGTAASFSASLFRQKQEKLTIGAKKNPRELAYSALAAFRKEGAWSDVFFREAAGKAELDTRDTALAARLFYGVLQNRSLLDFWLSRFCSVSLKKLEPQVLDILRMGIFQMAMMDRIPHKRRCERIR